MSFEEQFNLTGESETQEIFVVRCCFIILLYRSSSAYTDFLNGFNLESKVETILKISKILKLFCSYFVLCI